MTIFQLKMTALVLMVLDHIGYYWPEMYGAAGLRILGRGAYPLFLFCLVWGLDRTRSRGKYLLRLYGMGVFMAALSLAVDHLLPAEGGYGNHNIFVPMFLVGVIVTALERLSWDPRGGGRILAGLLAVQVAYVMLPGAFPPLKELSGDVLTGFLPNLALNEYGFPFVALGVAMYFLKEKKELFCGVYLLFCMYQLVGELTFEGAAVQWFMVIALPLMLLYNGERGRSWKWFFYVFYPAHTVLLFYLSRFVF